MPIDFHHRLAFHIYFTTGNLLCNIPQASPAYYDFGYAVKDHYGNDFGHQESRNGDNTKGSYSVILPDGRRQIVTYYVDGYSGYVADVKYEGEAKAYTDYSARPSKPSYYNNKNKPSYY